MSFAQLYKNIRTMLQVTADFKRPFAEGRGLKYSCPEDLVLREGTATHAVITQCDYPEMPLSNCFENAFRLSLEHPDLRYVEGYALFGSVLPAHHGWVVDAAGKVHDPTWLGLARERGHGKAVYWGIPVDPDTHLAWFIEHGTMNTLVNGEMIRPELLMLGMDYINGFAPSPPFTDEDRRILTDVAMTALNTSGNWTLDEATGIFTHSRDGTRWCGRTNRYLKGDE